MIVHGSNVLSPATFRILPLNGTSIDATTEAGTAAALQRYEKVSSVPKNPGISTLNKLGRDPPPVSLDLKSLIECADPIVFSSVFCVMDFYQTLPVTSSKLTPVLVATNVNVI